MTVPLQTDEQVTAWFELLAVAHDVTTTLPEFADAVRVSASWCDAEPFLRALTDAGEELAPVARILEVRDSMPGYYWELYQQWYPEPVEEDRFGWVLDDQGGALAAAWGDDWRTHLGPHLDYRWGAGWEAHPADHKQHWLADLLLELLDPDPAPAPATGVEPVSDPAAVDLDELAGRMVAESLAELDAELSEEELAEATAIVRHNLQEAMSGE